jgi:F-type H+-transporting ATPase subunit a
MVLFVRDEMVRPAIGQKEADRFVPFILTLFFFILFCNLLGLAPWLGSPTGSINVTGALALVAFLVVVGSGMRKFGPLRFWIGLCPQMELPWPLAILLVPMILGIEIFGLVIRHTILAVRLLANMFAGHLVLAVVLGFIALFVHSLAWYGVMPAAVLGGAALSLLELLVALLQAYIFAFLTALFIGMAIHQH